MDQGEKERRKLRKLVKKTFGSETLVDPDRQQLKTTGTALHNVPVFLYCDSDPAVDPTRSAT